MQLHLDVGEAFNMDFGMNIRAQLMKAGAHLDVIPSHMAVPSFSVTRNGLTPLRSFLTTSCANTTATQGRPSTGTVGGMYLIELIQAGKARNRFIAYLELARLGLCRLKLPSGRSVAVVPMLKASRPWPTSKHGQPMGHRRYSASNLPLDKTGRYRMTGHYRARVEV